MHACACRHDVRAIKPATHHGGTGSPQPGEPAATPGWSHALVTRSSPCRYPVVAEQEFVTPRGKGETRMAKHRVTLGRRGVAALVAAGALVIGGATATMIGTGNADVLDALTSGTATTTVLPDLAPFVKDDVRGAGKAEVSDEYGAPTGGGKAALRLSTPTGDDKVSYYATGDDAGTPLAAWIPTAAYSAYQGAADNPIQFPSLQLIVDYNGDETRGYSALTTEPVYNTGDSTAADEWHRYQAGTGLWCSTQVVPGVIESAETKGSNGG